MPVLSLTNICQTQIPSEVFASCVRAKAMSVAATMNRVTATLMSASFLSTATAIGWGGFFLLLSVISLVVLAFLFAFLPETKGRSLEDMSLYFSELTGDQSILEAEARIRGKEGVDGVEMTQSNNNSNSPGDGRFVDAEVI